jgi:hypothetical protein
MRTLPAEMLKLIVVFQPLFTKPTREHANPGSKSGNLSNGGVDAP